jgi:hypothetical protein
MRTSKVLIVDVRRSICLTVWLAGCVAGVATALYLASSTFVGRGAGIAVALTAATLLCVVARHRAGREPRRLALADDGTVRWIERSGRRGAGSVVAAARVGGLWVSLRVEPARIDTYGTPHTHDIRVPRALGRWLESRFAVRGWLITADALDDESFRQLAVRVPRMTAGRC